MEPDQGWPSQLSWEKPELGVRAVFSQDVRSSNHKSLTLLAMALSLGNTGAKWVILAFGNCTILSFSCPCHPGNHCSMLNFGASLVFTWRVCCLGTGSVAQAGPIPRAEMTPHVPQEFLTQAIALWKVLVEPSR